MPYTKKKGLKPYPKKSVYTSMSMVKKPKAKTKKK